MQLSEGCVDVGSTVYHVKDGVLRESEVTALCKDHEGYDCLITGGRIYRAEGFFLSPEYAVEITSRVLINDIIDLSKRRAALTVRLDMTVRALDVFRKEKAEEAARRAIPY
jgi:hypothetical protein